ncbi:unnamed protein product, partial [Ectocarpus fasciculatus]
RSWNGCGRSTGTRATNAPPSFPRSTTPPPPFGTSCTGSWAGWGVSQKTFLPPRRQAAAALVTRAAVSRAAAAVPAAATALAFPRRRRRLSWTTQTCSTAARSFRPAGCCARPLRWDSGCCQQGGEDENGWGPSQGGGGGGGDVDGGAAKANAGFGGGNCFMSTSGGGDENETTEDPYVRASLKRAIVELYDTCHRLLSFKMLNYDAFVRLMELHCRRPEAAGAPPRPPWSAAKMAGVGGGAGDHQGGKAGGAVGGEGMGALSKEKAMKVWLLEQPLFSARDLNGYVCF